ncbi:glycoside hydrolase family 99-like domain-containing protein [Niabella yanshanensis]|uniref:Glycoside hydrolase family 99-like domain-containing protein n=1 Tax=Niabella yanshanensis TaxID=577386 RepID=A0ABZ0W8Y7_9BACT|nr:glycoside hydrolase family 99-like domain-containing protein [Niabella yanshanensis]WQD38610.1 glycoside hydrolase family 99-like domain-containing protein [Niabella yanshanensis]
MTRLKKLSLPISGLLLLLFIHCDLRAQKYDVAAFYWPAYHYEPRIEFLFPEKKGEWEIIHKSKPKEAGHLQPKVPVWGYQDEADPREMNKKITAAVAHGVNTFIFDWYWYEGKPFLESCLNDGFLKANKGRMKFYIMWANHDATSYWDTRNPRKDSVIWKGGVNRAEFDKVTDRIIARYFKDPSYYKIDGKPVFCIYELQTLIDGLGGAEQTRLALDDFRRKVKAVGFPGLHLQGILWSALPANINGVPGDKIQTQDKVLSFFGFNSITNYCWAHLQNPEGDYEKWADASTDMWTGFTRDFSIPYFPNLTIGWDANPRYPFKAGYITNPAPDKFEKYLRKAKSFVDRHPEQPRLVTINAWNEWSEGSYLEPDTTHKMKYLEAVKRVFGSRK